MEIENCTCVREKGLLKVWPVSVTNAVGIFVVEMDQNVREWNMYVTVIAQCCCKVTTPLITSTVIAFNQSFIDSFTAYYYC